MGQKSHVGMGYYLCPVCGVEHDEVVLLDRFLRNKLSNHEFVGMQMCKEHQKLRDDGYTALIEVSNKPTGLADAVRTGQIAHIRNTAWPNLFDSLPPEGGIAFAEVGLFTKLQDKVAAHV